MPGELSGVCWKGELLQWSDKEGGEWWQSSRAAGAGALLGRASTHQLWHAVAFLQEATCMWMGQCSVLREKRNSTSA